ncbi:MAG: AGCS family alanine or glycine:cation symporter [Shewanella psychromarinicola]|jgi:AGCS family alanine or glycine:cation symporter
MEGIRITQNAMTYHMGISGDMFVAVIITLFSFTSVVANYAYAESNLHLFKLDNIYGRTGCTLLYLGMVYWEANASLKEVWNMADMALGLMTVVNISAIMLLTPTIVNLTRDYQVKLKSLISLNSSWPM